MNFMIVAALWLSSTVVLLVWIDHDLRKTHKENEAARQDILQAIEQLRQ